MIELDQNAYPSSTRAREDNVDAHDTSVYVFREGDEGERFEDGEIPTDPETHRMLADEHGFFDHESVEIVTTREEAVSQQEAGRR